MRPLFVLLSVATLTQSASAQDKVEVENFNFGLYTVTDETVTIDGRMNGKPMDILGFAVGKPAPDSRNNANGNLKANGYAVEFITNRLECRGQTLVGVSAPYLALIRARKLTNEFNENIEARFSSPSLGHQTYHVVRTINYTMPESAPTAAATEKSFIEKYGNIVTTQTTPAGHISQMTWEVPSALLVATFGYASNNPGVIQSIRMEQTRYAARQPMDVVRQEQIKICGVTRQHDEARIKQRNQQGSTAPKL